LLPTVRWDAGIAQAWQPGEAAGQARLREFVESALSAYEHGRDRPAEPGVSRLSPHLHFGELSPRQVWHAVQGLPGADAFLRELGWREFAHHVLFHWPHTPDRPLRPEYARFPWRDPGDAAPLLKAWQQGRTGIPWVDAGMRELWSTGWMHNRVRMGAASFLTKHCRVPWQQGARWFWDTLVDADLANNTLNWQWSAGCGADAAPYFRIFNPVQQASRFDPEGAYLRRWIPELQALPAPWIFRPWETPAAVQAATGFRPGRDYPEPVIDLKQGREDALAAFARFRERH
jgi:deoxyribodipyrimidine photo-lyase